MVEQEMLAKLILCGGVSVILGPVLAFVATPTFCIFRKIFYVTSKQDKLRSKAIENGHVVQAKLIKQHQILDYNPRYDGTAVYEYVYGQRKYCYRCMVDGWPEEEIELYFIRNPKKAAAWGGIGMHERTGLPWIVYYLIFSFVIGVIVFVIGVKYISGI